MADELDKQISQELKRITRTQAKTRYAVMSGKVKGAVDEGELSCKVVLSDDNPDSPTEDITVNTKLQITDGLVLYPADGSFVWVAEIDGPGKYGLLKCSTLDKAVLTIGTSKLTITAAGYKIERGSTNLGTVLHNIITHITQLTVPTGTGPSGVPVNAAAFNIDSNDLSQILI